MRAIVLALWFWASASLAQYDCTAPATKRFTGRGANVPMYPTQDWYPTPWHLDRVDQTSAVLDHRPFERGGRGGYGVHVYVVDTGIAATHSEFTGRLDWGWSAYAGDAWLDRQGHGTHVASTLAGTTHGVAPLATIHSIRVFDTGGASSGLIASGLDAILARGPVGIVNMSLSGGASPVMDAAVCRLLAAGYQVFIAAGNNSGDACLYSPARVVQATTVGAIDEGDKISSFSNRGACVDLYTPGRNVRAGVPSGGFAAKNGTSMATPVAAGLAATGSWRTYPVMVPTSLILARVEPTAEALLLGYQVRAWFDIGAGWQVASPRILTRNGLLFWFFQPDNPELLLKILEADWAGFDWVYIAGTTDVGVRVEVERNGVVKRYQSERGQRFATITDTTAFPRR